jgi:ketosteroid isomerase-like protein
VSSSAIAETWQAIETVPEDIRQRGDRVVAIVNRRLRGRGSGIDLEERIGIVYEVRDGIATRIWAYRDVDEPLAEAEVET